VEPTADSRWLVVIVCSHCESSQFLHITESTIEFDDGEMRTLEESYHCTNCDGTGIYWYFFQRECVSGSVELTDERPRMIEQ